MKTKNINEPIDNIIISIMEKCKISKFSEFVPDLRETEQELLNQLTKAVEQCVKDGMDLKAIVEHYKEKFPNDLLWDELEKIVSVNTLPYLQTKFIREMDATKRSDLFQMVFENIILYKEKIEYIQEISGQTRSETKIVIKLLNTIRNMVITRRMTERYFTEEAVDIFQLEKCDIRYLWELFNEHKETLITNTLFDNHERIKDELSEIKELAYILSGILNDEEEEV